jgi:pyrophosphatase PpaX
VSAGGVSRGGEVASRRGRLRAVLFDLDGTLFESRRLYGEAYRRAVLPILERPLTREDLHRISPRSESAFFEAAVPEARRAEAVEAFRREYSALHETGFDGLFDGVADLLRAVGEAGLRRGVVSGKSRMSWQVTAAHLQLVDAFDVVVLDDDVLAPKPDPEGMRLALEALGLEAAEAAYIGDTASDMAAAGAAGIWPILAAWATGDGPREERARSAAEQVGADIVTSPAAVVDLLLGT